MHRKGLTTVMCNCKTRYAVAIAYHPGDKDWVPVCFVHNKGWQITAPLSEWVPPTDDLDNRIG